MTFNNEVTVVLVTHKSKKKALSFINKLTQNVRTIIIDNSKDFNLEREIKNNYKHVKIYLIENNGYGAAINFARKKIDTKFFFVFNPDVQNIKEEVVEKFYQISLKLDNNFSCLGPRYLNIDNKSLKQTNVKEEIAEIESISGASMYFNAIQFDTIGGFDENFFLYFEESDFCKRASKKKLKCYQINSISVNHIRGTSVECSSEEEIAKLKDLYAWHFIWSKFYFYRKHYSFTYAIFYFAPILLRTLFKIILCKIFKRKISYRKYRSRLSGLISSIKGKNSFKRI